MQTITGASLPDFTPTPLPSYPNSTELLIIGSYWSGKIRSVTFNNNELLWVNKDGNSSLVTMPEIIQGNLNLVKDAGASWSNFYEPT